MQNCSPTHRQLFRSVSHYPKSLFFSSLYSILLLLFSAFGFIISFWGSVVWQTLFTAFFAFPAIFLGLQLVLVVKCKHPPLVLEPKGLRMNFTGDFIRYDQIIDVTFSYYSFAMMILRLAPGVKLKSGLAAYAMGRRPLFTALYTMSVSDLAAEIERRMKALDGGQPLREIEAGTDAASQR